MYKILAIVVLIGFSAYFSASETAFTSVNRIRIKNLANDGDKKARAVQELSERYDDLLSTILVGNNIVNIATSAIATVHFHGDVSALRGNHLRPLWLPSLY